MKKVGAHFLEPGEFWERRVTLEHCLGTWSVSADCPKQPASLVTSHRAAQSAHCTKHWARGLAVRHSTLSCDPDKTTITVLSPLLFCDTEWSELPVLPPHLPLASVQRRWHGVTHGRVEMILWVSCGDRKGDFWARRRDYTKG